MITFKTIEDIRHVRYADGKYATEPQPYPGRYPTRVAWYIASKTPLWYMGRPNLLQLSRALAIRGRHLAHGWEFDRGGVIATWQTGTYGLPGPLWKHYHPFQRPGAWFEGFRPWFEMKRESGRVFYVPGNMQVLAALQQEAGNVQLDGFANVVIGGFQPLRPNDLEVAEAVQPAADGYQIRFQYNPPVRRVRRP